jgi:hypothetical protein
MPCSRLEFDQVVMAAISLEKMLVHCKTLTKLGAESGPVVAQVFLGSGYGCSLVPRQAL